MVTFDTIEKAREAAQAKADASARDVVIRLVDPYAGPAGPFRIRFCRGEKGTATSTDYVLGEVITPNWDNVDWNNL
jgi:hypothetical protein